MPGHRDHRHPPQIRILQSGREVRRPHRLRETHTWFAGDSGIAVGHIRHGLLAMTEHPLDAEGAELNERAAQHGVDEKDVAGAVRGKAAGEILGAGDGLGHWYFPRLFARSVGTRLNAGNLTRGWVRTVPPGTMAGISSH